MKKVLTEAELWEKDQKKPKMKQTMRANGFSAEPRKEEYIIRGICKNIIFGEDGFNRLGVLIEKWMDENSNDPTLIITSVTEDGQNNAIPFKKYIVNFQHCNNCMEQWMLVKCDWKGYNKIHSRFIQEIQLSSSCYKYDKDMNKISPNIFNLLSCEEKLRNHSSALKPMPTQKEIDDIIAGWSNPQQEKTEWDSFDNSAAKSMNEESIEVKQ